MKQAGMSCVLLGENGLVIACGKYLIEKKWRIKAVVSDNEQVVSWGQTNGLCVLNGLQMDKIGEKEFDFLFSIVYYKIIPAYILKLPKQLAINYHDALLPTYAGIHATSWAIRRGERRHGITWHVMEEEVDAGDILIQERIMIQSKDTAFSLNLKCFQAAVNGFCKLIELIMEKRIICYPQDLSKRSYFGRWQKYGQAGLIDWTQKEGEISRFVKGTYFGDYDNTFMTSKVMLQNQFYIVECVEKYAKGFDEEPGMAKVESDVLVVATKTRPLAIRHLRLLTGEEAELSSIVGQMSESFSLLLNADRLQILEDYVNSISCYEEYWVHKLKMACVAKGDMLELVEESEDQEIILPQMGESTLLEKLLFSIYTEVHRSNHIREYYIGYHENLQEGLGLGADLVPFHLYHNDDYCMERTMEQLKEERTQVIAKKTFLLDVYYRYQELRGKKNLYDIAVIVGSMKQCLEKKITEKIVFVLNESLTQIDCIWRDEKSSVFAKRIMKNIKRYTKDKEC